MTSETNNQLLKFTPFISCVDPGFWHKMSQLKLEVDKLHENEHNIWGYYSNKKQEGLKQVFSIDTSSFNEEPDSSRIFGHGKIINKNTIEGYKGIDKIEILKRDGAKLMEIIKNSAIENPSLLNMFIIISFADLKLYIFYYKFLFLAPTFISYNLIEKKFANEVFDSIQLGKIVSGYNELSPSNKSFFLINVSENNTNVVSVKEGLTKIDNNKNWIFGFADSCEQENPGWPLRNYLAFISYHCKEIIKSPIKVLGLRLQLLHGNWHIDSSIILNVQVNLKEGSWERGAAGEDWVGWERNAKGQAVTKTANLRSLLDPIKMAETSVELNLKLIKWQLLPNLDLDIIKKTKCLLLGSGTLGCAVGRDLLAWGVHKITFVDYGNVSYSNPLRQCLFKFKDAGKPKAKTAASGLKEIYPNVDSNGFTICIPMPGHPIGENLKAETEKNIHILENLIEEHDAIFLLMDSRESRWLPALLGAAHQKLVITAAIGFDSFLVMRHGFKCEESPKNDELNNLIGSQLGCYFCNDITAPGDSSTLRTLDQQCTVTRPGVSTIAGALAVEMLVSILQHPLKGLAPAESDPEATTDGLLGIIPHSVRGFISNYSVILPATRAFNACVACSPKVINEYKERRIDFILKALDSKEYLEDLCGLRELLQEPIISQIEEFSDLDSDS